MPSAVQSRAMGWVGQVRRPAGYLLTAEAAKVIGLSGRGFRSLVASGRLAWYPSPGGGGTRVYREAEVIDLAAERMVQRGLRAQKKAAG